MDENAIDERRVIVGIDGSPESAVALRWAMEHADRLGRVVPVTIYQTGPFEDAFAPHTGSDSDAGPHRTEAMRRLSQFLYEFAPSLAGDAMVVENRTGPGLVEVADGSELLVLGTRESAGHEDVYVGAVAAYCAHRSRVPVALVPRGLAPPHDRLSVVVGVDGSDQSIRALRWTLDHVRHTALVTAVRVTTAGPIAGDPLTMSDADVEAAAFADLEARVARVAAGAHGHPEVDLLVVSGDPRDALGTAVAGADLLVVGARGHGVIRRLMLGSVAAALAHHPTLPTIVVPDGRP